MNTDEDDQPTADEINQNVERLRLEAAQELHEPDQLRFVELLCDAAITTPFVPAKVAAYALAIAGMAGGEKIVRFVICIRPLMEQLNAESEAAVAANRRGEGAP